MSCDCASHKTPQVEQIPQRGQVFSYVTFNNLTLGKGARSLRAAAAMDELCSNPTTLSYRHRGLLLILLDVKNVVVSDEPIVATPGDELMRGGV